MPNRIIKESIKRSPEIDRLSWFEEVVFYRLIVTADDYGRLDGRTIVLRNDLFPTKETVTKKSIEDAVSKLVSVGLLVPYVDAESDMPYLVFKKWDKHQTVRNKYSKYPTPPEDLITNCKHLQADCKQTSVNCQYESEPNIESESKYKECDKRAARFSPPTADMVNEYCREHGYNVDGQRFVDFYTSKGWKVGNTPMKDWKAAVRTWVTRDKQSAAAKVTPVNPALDYDQREYKDEDFGDDFFVDLDAYAAKEG